MEAKQQIISTLFCTKKEMCSEISHKTHVVFTNTNTYKENIKDYIREGKNYLYPTINVSVTNKFLSLTLSRSSQTLLQLAFFFLVGW